MLSLAWQAHGHVVIVTFLPPLSLLVIRDRYNFFALHCSLFCVSSHFLLQVLSRLSEVKGGFFPHCYFSYYRSSHTTRITLKYFVGFILRYYTSIVPAPFFLYSAIIMLLLINSLFIHKVSVTFYPQSCILLVNYFLNYVNLFT